LLLARLLPRLLLRLLLRLLQLLGGFESRKG